MEGVTPSAFSAAPKRFEEDDLSQSVGEQKIAFIGSLGYGKGLTFEEYRQIAEETDREYRRISEENIRKHPQIVEDKIRKYWQIAKENDRRIGSVQGEDASKK